MDDSANGNPRNKSPSPGKLRSGSDATMPAISKPRPERSHSFVHDAAGTVARTRIYEQIARIGKAVSASKRIEILDLLCQGPCSVELLATRVDVTVANASKHLQVLRTARLVESRKIGLHVEYRIADSNVSRFVHSYELLRPILTLSHESAPVWSEFRASAGGQPHPPHLRTVPVP